MMADVRVGKRCSKRKSSIRSSKSGSTTKLTFGFWLGICSSSKRSISCHLPIDKKMNTC